MPPVAPIARFMLRFFVRRVPRFGFLTLFAAMLLFVSAAGWLKFHLDLWREEEALLKDLGNAGVDYTIIRHSGSIGGSFPTNASSPKLPPPKLWKPLIPLFSRIERIGFDDPAPRELLQRAARLPFIETVGGGGRPTGTMSTEAVAAKAGFELRKLSTPSIPSELSALPDGESLEGEDADEAGAAFVASLKTEKSVPTRGTAYLAHAAPVRHMFHARDGDVRFSAFDGCSAISTSRSHETFMLDGGGFKQDFRLDDPAWAFEILVRKNPPLLQFDPRTCLERNLSVCEIASRFQELLGEREMMELKRIDERRVRIDFPPIVVEYPAVDCRDAYSISMIARSDLDWELEAWDLVGVRTKGPKTPATLAPIASASYRGTLRREQEWVVAENWVADWIAGPIPPVVASHPPTNVPSRMAGVARYDFSPDIDLSHVTPELFDAEMLPPRRKLPSVSWHQATFVLSLCLFAFVVSRKIAKRKAPSDAS